MQYLQVFSYLKLNFLLSPESLYFYIFCILYNMNTFIKNTSQLLSDLVLPPLHLTMAKMKHSSFKETKQAKTYDVLFPVPGQQYFRWTANMLTRLSRFGLSLPRTLVGPPARFVSQSKPNENVGSTAMTELRPGQPMTGHEEVSEYTKVSSFHISWPANWQHIQPLSPAESPCDSEFVTQNAVNLCLTTDFYIYRECIIHVNTA